MFCPPLFVLNFLSLFFATVFSIFRITVSNHPFGRVCRGRDRMVVADLQLKSVPITTKVVSSNPAHGEVYSIQHYVIKFVSDLR